MESERHLTGATDTLNPKLMQDVTACELASNDKTRINAGHKGLSVGGQR